MKVFIADQGAYGGHIVIAETQEQAIDIMIGQDNVAGYAHTPEQVEKIRKDFQESIQELPLVSGSSYLFMGDR